MRPGRSHFGGRSYRVHRHRGHHHHGGYYYRWYDPHRLRYPYYRHYGPRYGLYFGFGLSYYPEVYAPYFVDATPYYGPGVIVEEEIIDDGSYGAVPYEEVVPQEEFQGGVVPPGVAPDVIEPEAAPAAEPFPEPAPDAEAAPAEEAPPAKPHADFQPGVDAFMRGDYYGAMERFARVLQAEPDNGEVWLALVHTNFALARYSDASRALAQAAALDAFPRGYRFDPRPLYTGRLSFDEAFKALKDHAAAKPADADAQLLLAYFHMAQGDRAAAQTAVQRALEIRPADETAPRLALALLPPPPPPKNDERSTR